MFPILQIGPLAIQTPGLILLVGLWIGLQITDRYALKQQMDRDLPNNLVFFSLLAGIVGARLGYVAGYPEIFIQDPGSLLSINPGLLDVWSGLSAGFIAALIYGRWKKLPFWKTLDVLSPAIGIFLVATSMANLASGNGYGAPTQLPWAIELWGANRHPSQLYEAAAGCIILWAIWPGKRLGKPQFPGLHFLALVVLYSAARLFLEAFRGDSDTWISNIRSDQVLDWVILAAGLWLAGRLLRSNKRELQTSSENTARSASA